MIKEMYLFLAGQKKNGYDFFFLMRTDLSFQMKIVQLRIFTLEKFFQSHEISKTVFVIQSSYFSKRIET